MTMTRPRALAVCLLFFLALVPVCHMAEGAAPTEGSGASQEQRNEVVDMGFETPELALEQFCESLEYAFTRAGKVEKGLGVLALREAIAIASENLTDEQRMGRMSESMKTTAGNNGRLTAIAILVGLAREMACQMKVDLVGDAGKP